MPRLLFTDEHWSKLMPILLENAIYHKRNLPLHLFTPRHLARQAGTMTDLQAEEALDKANCALFKYVMKQENRV